MKLYTTETFDAAHVLSDYEGKCSNLHGHTYKVEVSMEDEVDKDSHMVFDFNDFKHIVRSYLETKYDHATLFSSEVIQNAFESELYALLIKHNRRTVLLNHGCKSTAEDMAVIMQHELTSLLNCTKVTVRLWETPTNCVEVGYESR